MYIFVKGSQIICFVFCSRPKQQKCYLVHFDRYDSFLDLLLPTAQVLV